MGAGQKKSDDRARLGEAWTGGEPLYTYEAGEPWVLRKHAGGAATASFAERGGVTVGKCPKGFTLTRAIEVLNAATTLRVRRAASPEGQADWVFAVVDGVLYRGVQTGRGNRAYHAFPECKTKFEELPLWVRKEVEAWAQTHQLSATIKEWLKKSP